LQLCYNNWQEIALLPRRLILDATWLLVSEKGEPWTTPTESDLILKNLWDAFPPDVTPEEIGLPTSTSSTTPAPPLGVTTNPVSADGILSTRGNIHSRHRRNRATGIRGPRSENVTDFLREEDIADQLEVRCELAVLW
jgi:hypothetical protein